MKKKIILGIVAALIIITALMGILYYTTDLFKSPDQLFYKHLADDVNFLGKTTYADVMKELRFEIVSMPEFKSQDKVYRSTARFRRVIGRNDRIKMDNQ